MRRTARSLFLLSLIPIASSLLSCNHESSGIVISLQKTCGIASHYEKEELVSGETYQLSDGECFRLRFSSETIKEEVVCTYNPSRVIETKAFSDNDGLAFRTVGSFDEETFSVALPNGRVLAFKIKSTARAESTLSCDVKWYFPYEGGEPERLLDYHSDPYNYFLSEEDGILPGEKVTLEYYGCTWGNAMVGQPLILDGRPIGIKRSSMEVEEFVVDSKNDLKCVSSNVSYSEFNASFFGIEKDNTYVFTGRDLSYVHLSALEIGTKVYGTVFEDGVIGSLFTFNPANPTA